MIKSMTGYGQGIYQGENCRVVVDIKSVNNRHLDIHLKLPQELAQTEPLLKKRVQPFVKRGRIDILVTVTQTEEINYDINLPLIKGYLRAIELIKQEFNIKEEPIDIGLFTRLPGAIQPSKIATSTDQETTAAIEKALDQALTMLCEMRSQEGSQLAIELEKHLSLIDFSIPVIEASADQILPLYTEKLQKRIQELLRNSSATIDETRLAQEAAYLAERSDITEEIARLKSHIIQFRQVLESGEEAGKKLDFLLQEMNRETNTILSKSGELEISRLAIEIKSEIEKLREQCQNVE